MQTQGLNTEVKAGGKKFHVQTNYLEAVEKIISSIYEDGQILFKKERHVDEANVDKVLENGIKALHKETIDDIELLDISLDMDHYNRTKSDSLLSYARHG